MKHFFWGGNILPYRRDSDCSIIEKKKLPCRRALSLLYVFRYLHFGRHDATKVGGVLLIIFCVLFSGPDLLGTGAMAQSQHRAASRINFGDKSPMVSPAWAQEAKGLKKPNALQIGDTIPDELWNMPLQVVNNPDKIRTITLNDYRGKLIILDFWATWCGACIAAFPKLDTLQQKYAKDVAFLSISTESKNQVARFTRFQHNETPNLTFIADSKELDNYFKYGSLPHYIWIDSKGIIRSTSESLQVNASNIDEALKGKFNFRTKTDVIVEYDFDRSLLQNVGNDETAQVNFSSTLMPYQIGLKSMRKISTDEDKGRKVTLLNVPLFWLYITAYSTNGQGFWKSNTLIEVKEHEKIVKRGTPGQRYSDWLAAGNGYCYEQIVRYQDRDSCFKYMQADLDRMLPQYKAAVELREHPCYILKIADEKKYLKSLTKKSVESTSYGSTDSTFNGTNMSLDVLAGNISESERIDYSLFNETGRNDRVTIMIPNPKRGLSLTNLHLSNYGLVILKEKRTKPFLVIKDRPVL